MKIGIITVYYSENCGSLLQAISLEKKFKELGHDVVFIYTRNKYSSHSLKLLLGRILKESIKFKIGNVNNAIKKYFNFKKNIKRFKVITIGDIKKYGLDLIVIGSDTVWDIESKYFNESFKVFLPKLDSIPVVSYAASVGNTSVKSIKKDDYSMEALQDLKLISVRDEYSKSVLSKLTNKKIEIVPDPTIMIGKDAFNEFIYNVDEEKYLLIYSFNDFEKNIVDEIRKYAKENNLNIISIGKKYDWVDKNVICSLNTFISYYNLASCVVTNTFHGNVFSIIFNKQFINIDFGKKKVDKLLEQYGLTNRIYKKGISKISNIFDKKIDYEKVNKLMEEDRKTANKIINSFLDKNNNKIYKSIVNQNGVDLHGRNR